MEAWNEFLRNLEERIGKEPVEKWIKPLKVVRFDACNLYLESENSFQRQWFEEHVRSIAKSELKNNNGHLIKVHFPPNKAKRAAGRLDQAALVANEIKSDPIAPNHCFSNFIFEEKNRLTLQFFQELSPGLFNPLFLHGEKGVGKTHLLCACASALLEKGLSVFYVHAETFTQHVVEAIRSSRMRSFRVIYRNQDVLIVDDVHLLARRFATQEEFFHTFNALHTAGKQMILSSSQLPSQMEEIEARLISRFEWGILMQLAPLPPEKMEQVVQIRAKAHQFPLSDAVSSFLTSHFSSSPKSILRSLDALMLRHKSPTPITEKEAKVYLKDLLEEEAKQHITPEKIIGVTGSYFGILPEDILGKSQAKECAEPRKLAMYLCRKHLGLSYPAIGRAFGRDHSTVMTAVRQIEKKSGSNEWEAAFSEIESSLKS